MEFTDEQFRAIEWTERVCSIVSLLGSFFVVGSFLFSSRFQAPINRLIFYASLGNILTNVATLVSRSGIKMGGESGLCRFQGLFIQWFMPADALWTFCMACNVYLTFFRRYSTSQLRKLEWRYFILCYGLPFLPAFVYLFVESQSKGNIYGPAILWCWISIQWSVLRLATFYGPVWLVIVLTLGIYILAGREIIDSRRQLRKIFDSFRAVEEPLEGPVRNRRDLRAQSGAGIGISVIADNHFTVHNERIPSPPPGNEAEMIYQSGSSSIAVHTAAWAYAQCAIMFFIALFVTWIPSTVNRVYSFIRPHPLSFALHYISSFVLPLQGFWNSIIYIATSFPAVKELFAQLRPQKASCFILEPRDRG